MRHSKINGLNSRSTTLRAAIVPTAFLLFVGIVFLVYLLNVFFRQERSIKYTIDNNYKFFSS